MLKIGEFSKIAQVSIKTLRYYDQIGLLKPEHIDRYSGYRYYSLIQLVRLNRILALKDLDFSLDQIRDLLKQDLPVASLEVMLQNKADELRQHIQNEHGRLLRVENRLQNLKSGFDAHLSPIVLKSTPQQLAITVRQVLYNSQSLKEWRSVQLEKIERKLAALNQPVTGPSLLIYHQDEFRETNLDVEVGMILPEPIKPLHRTLKEHPFRLASLDEVNQMASIVTTQTTGPLSRAYTSIVQWTQANGFRPIGPWRELTFNEDPQGAQVIEIQRPVMNALKYYQQLEEQKMEPEIKTRDAFTIVGLRYFGKNEHGEIHELWGQFNQRMEEMDGLEYATHEAAIGLCITPEDAPEDGSFEYVAGLPVTDVKDVPKDFVVRHVPENTYAVFAHKGDLASLPRTYEYIYETWLPQSSYKLAAKVDFEYYNEDFNDFEPDSVFYIYVPIEKA